MITTLVVHWYFIKVLNENHEIIDFIKWENLPYNIRTKYNWYFKYRAALLQVKYPKYSIETCWGSEPAEGKSLEDIKKNILISKKRLISKFENKLNFAIKEWN